MFSQAKADAGNSPRRDSRCVVATWLVDTGVEEGPDQKTVARGWCAGTDGGSSSGTATGFALIGGAAAIRCIVKASREKSVHDDGCEAISGWRRRSTRRNDLGRGVRATVRGTAGCEPRFEAGVA